MRHVLDWSNDDPRGPYDTPTSRMTQFASGANVTLDGNVKAERWRRIEILGHTLGDRWTPFVGSA